MTAEATDSASTCGVTILVVDDEAPVRLLVRRILERQGYRVVEADSAVAALNLWPSHKESVNLLLTDLAMPEGITGRQLADKLRAEKPSLKVIFTSGYSRESLGSDFPIDEPATFLQKPYQPKKLTDTIRACLDTK